MHEDVTDIQQDWVHSVAIQDLHLESIQLAIATVVQAKDMGLPVHQQGYIW